MQRADLARHGMDLAVVRKTGELAEIEQDVERRRQAGIGLEGAEVRADILEGERPDAAGTDQPPVGVDLVFDGHAGSREGGAAPEPYPCGWRRIHSKAVRTIASRSSRRGRQPSSRRARSAAATSTGGSPGLRARTETGRRAPLTRLTASTTCSTE